MTVIALQTIAELLILSDPPPGSLTLGAVGMVDGYTAVGLEVEDVARSGPPGTGRCWDDEEEEGCQ